MCAVNHTGSQLNPKAAPGMQAANRGEEDCLRDHGWGEGKSANLLAKCFVKELYTIERALLQRVLRIGADHRGDHGWGKEK